MKTHFYHDTRFAADESEGKDYPIKIALTHQGRSSYLPTGISVPVGCWNGKRKEVVEYPHASKLNIILSAKKLQVDKALDDLKESGRLRGLTIFQIKDLVREKIDGRDGTGKPLTVGDWFERYADKCEKERTAFGYRYTLKRIMQFTGGKPLTFESLTPAWLEEFDRYLGETAPNANARSIHMRNIRAVFNDALSEGVINAPYPFRKFKIKSQPTGDRSMTVEELRTLFEYDCTPVQRKYRDIFELSFLLCGINIADLLSLDRIHRGRIDFLRAKTGQPVSLFVTDRAKEIIDRYRGEERLLNVADGCSDYKNFLRRVNKNLQEIGMTYNRHTKKWEGSPLFPDITYYWARFSWATIAAELDIPEKTIGAAMGHSTGKSVTSIYIRVNMRKKTDEANQKVINYVYGSDKICKVEK